MCGITGALGVDDPSMLDDMASCIGHRGPDGYGTHVDDGVMLANQRLSVIDVEGGDQPIYDEDGDVVVVYNGEIYNFRELRKELEASGHRFSTESDTEVIVHGYEEHGTDVFGMLNGMFAVALWDGSDEKLVLARDRAGVKPLYVYEGDDLLLFGSEPKSILRSGVVAPEVDREALSYFLQMRYSPPRCSLFQGIEKLPPGTYLEVEVDGDGVSSTETRFWGIEDAPNTAPSDPEDAVREALSSAVERQLVSDVPVGFYLSGGLDTSSVVAMASEASDEPIHTFCMGFESQRWDERPDARAVADHFDTVHHEISIEDDFMQDFPRMIWHADEPKRNLYPYYVAEEMREHVKVALGGLGADELFGGYVYRYNRLGELQRTRESGGVEDDALQGYRRQLEDGDLEDDSVMEELSCLRHLDDDDAVLYVLLNSTDVLGDTEFYRERIFGDDLPEAEPAEAIVEATGRHGDSDDLREKALRWDLQVKMPDDFLLVEDRMSMAHSLESRVPFLDNELVDLALSLPLSQKIDVTGGRDVGKLVLRRAMKPVLPDVVFDKDKQGFTMPTYPFVRDEMLEHSRCILDDPLVVKEGFVDGDYLDDVLGRTPEESLTPHYKMLWKLTALEMWTQMYLDGDVTGPEPIESYYS